MSEAFVYDAVRTPRSKGRPGGALNGVKPVDLIAGLIREVERRNPDLDPAMIEDVVLGCATPVGDQGADIARTAAVVAGLPDSVPGVQLNRFCGSGLDAVNQAAARVRSGWEHLILAGGVESMSRVEMGSDGGAAVLDPATNYALGFVPQGIGADLIASIEGFSRRDVDTYAVESQDRAAKAQANGHFARSIVPVVDRSGVTVLDRDDHLRPGTTVDDLARLTPSFAEIGVAAGFDDVALQKYHAVESIDHVHHAGNSSGIVDGAAVTLIGSGLAGERSGLVPRARIVATAVVGSEPTIMLTGPEPACRKALDLAGMTASDIDLLEINEAFASVPLKLMADLGIDHDRTNVNGGAIAIGHPLGATGAVLIGTVLDELERRELTTGMVTLCIGGGMGIATIIERTETNA